MKIQTINPITKQQSIVLELLKDKKVYPHQISKINLQETHISWIFLTGKYAYKVKKELKFGKILDFSTLSLRRKFCQKEVDLNKLLCPDIYKGVVRIGRESDGSIRIRDMNMNQDRPRSVKTLEYAVKMKEIPQKYCMDHLVCKERISTKTITRLAEVLVKFHNSTPTNNRIMLFGRPKSLKMKITENFNTLSKLANIHPKFEQKLLSFIANNSTLLYHRINQSKIRDIHGDLYLKNIFIVHHKFYLYDRIEFNDSLRYADVAEDVAHVSMDLDYHKKFDLRKHFFSQYIKRSKDSTLKDLIYFWMCHKAFVRAKVSFFSAKGGIDKQRRATSIKEAVGHLRLAASYIELF
jgi:aminoglycoside phosphotransferase family enzyme